MNSSSEHGGGAGNDYIIGNSGSDTITGNGDTLTGGGGADTFVFKAVADSQPGAGLYDTITDFTHASDLIDFSAMSGLNDIIQTVHFISDTAAPTSLDAHTIDIVTSGGNTVIYANAGALPETVGVGADIMEIQLTSPTGVVAQSDFILHH